MSGPYDAVLLDQRVGHADVSCAVGVATSLLGKHFTFKSCGDAVYRKSAPPPPPIALLLAKVDEDSPREGHTSAAEHTSRMCNAPAE